MTNRVLVVGATTVALMSTTFLTSCGKPEPKIQTGAYKSVEQCSYDYKPADCEKAFKQAELEHMVKPGDTLYIIADKRPVGLFEL